MDQAQLIEWINTSVSDKELKLIALKVANQERISGSEGLYLFQNAPLGFLGVLSDFINLEKNGNRVFFNRNFHIEPTNICVNKCKFCSYRREKGEEGCWEYSFDEMFDLARKRIGSEVTEVHIVGGVHPDRDIHFYGQLLQGIQDLLPRASLKAFTAVELAYLFDKETMSYSQGLAFLKKKGLKTIPGGGAEIFDEIIREKICPGKLSSEKWLLMHREAHLQGIPTNATMLYGHIENYGHRIDHLERLRILQDETHGFNCFIPLKFKRLHNTLSTQGEVSVTEDMRNFAISRIFLDNFHHLKAYWPMIGQESASLSLSFGVDDLDGTIDDSTKIYSMAGADDQNPSLTTQELIKMIQNQGRIAVERDSFYNVIKEF